MDAVYRRCAGYPVDTNGDSIDGTTTVTMPLGDTRTYSFSSHLYRQPDAIQETPRGGLPALTRSMDKRSLARGNGRHRIPEIGHPSSATMPRLTVLYRPIATLLLNPFNPRIHSPKQIRQIAKSIAAFGFNVPILIDEAGKVIAGHGRLLARAELGLTDVPTVELAHLSEPQK
jgi:hypothetical protein